MNLYEIFAVVGSVTLNMGFQMNSDFDIKNYFFVSYCLLSIVGVLAEEVGRHIKRQ